MMYLHGNQREVNTPKPTRHKTWHIRHVRMSQAISLKLSQNLRFQEHPLTMSLST